MSQEALGIYLRLVQRAFLDGDIEELLDYFCLPLVVYTSAGVTLIRDRAEFARMAAAYRSALMAMSVDHAELQIVSEDPTVNDRLRATVRWIDYNAEGNEVTGSLVRYFLVSHRPGHFVTEMIEYLETPVSHEEVERIVH